MEFLSTDKQEIPDDCLLSETSQDFSEELRLLMEAHDLIVEVPTTQIVSSDTTSCASECGLSPVTSVQEDDLLCVLNQLQPTAIGSPKQSPILQSKPPCNNSTTQCTGSPLDRNRKNALAAKLNRQKKKEYVQSLETQVSSLQLENKQLKLWYSQMEESVSKLQLEVKYLKNVLANESTLSTLLQSIPRIEGVRLSTSLVAGKRSRTDNDIDFCSSKKAAAVKGDADFELASGVCLHVMNNTASLEFCAECSQRSVATCH